MKITTLSILALLTMIVNSSTLCSLIVRRHPAITRSLSKRILQPTRINPRLFNNLPKRPTQNIEQMQKQIIQLQKQVHKQKVAYSKRKTKIDATLLNLNLFAVIMMAGGTVLITKIGTKYIDYVYDNTTEHHCKKIENN